MRCPSCSGFNRDDAIFCKLCGRSLSSVSTSQQSNQQQRPPQPQPRPDSRQPQPRPDSRQPQPRPAAYPPPQPQPPRPVYQPPQPPPYRQPVVAPPSPPRPSTPQIAPSARATRSPALNAPLQAPAMPTAPDAPAPFPPRTMEHLRLLEQGALPYILVDKSVANGRRQVIRIAYQKCAAWQQVATLCKALKEHQVAEYETVIIQGVPEKDTNAYNFTNGQMIFDRNVRLGSQMLKRYQIETGDGYANDSVRIVLVE